MQRTSLLLISALALTWVFCSPAPSLAQTPADDAADTAWQLKAIMAMQRMRAFHDVDTGTQPTPPVIGQNTTDADPSGTISTYQPGGNTQTSSNPFFQNLGTNGRTCFTCHQPQTGWTVSAQSVQARFNASSGADPIFRLVDGATCPTDDVSSVDKKRQAYSLLLSKGLIRIGLPIPANAEFQIAVVSDPYTCNTNPPTPGIVSIYRRPLPSTNLGFLSTIMWDGRELTLSQQAVDATTGHAQANPPGPSAAQQQEIVNFESGLFTAQSFDNAAQDLDALGAAGGPVDLQGQLASFFIGINDPLGQNPTGAQFNPNIFNLYQVWSSPPGNGAVKIDRESVERGETVNTTQINIKGVGGLNDTTGFCGTCHDTPNVGNHSVKAPLNIGIADAGSSSPPALDISGLPVFSLSCPEGSFVVTDPGRALISGKCADIGKIKGPILRGLAARAPYFHNGSAATLMDVVNFYDQRFSIGFTDQQKQDLVNFLNTL